MTPGAYQPVGTARVTERGPGRVRLAAGDALAEVTALAPDCFRVGLFGGGRPVEYPAHAVSPREPAPAEPAEGGDVVLATAEGRAVISLDPLRISFARADGTTLAADDPELGMGFVPPPESDWVGTSLGPAPQLHKRRGDGERFFGCGERTARAREDRLAPDLLELRPARRGTRRRSTTSTRRSRSCSGWPAARARRLPRQPGRDGDRPLRRRPPDASRVRHAQRRPRLLRVLRADAARRASSATPS